jgi:hypothetical protein
MPGLYGPDSLKDALTSVLGTLMIGTSMRCTPIRGTPMRCTPTGCTPVGYMPEREARERGTSIVYTSLSCIPCQIHACERHSQKRYTPARDACPRVISAEMSLDQRPGLWRAPRSPHHPRGGRRCGGRTVGTLSQVRGLASIA